MGPRGEPYDEQPGLGIAEAGHRPSPVLKLRILFFPFPGDLAAVTAKAGAELATNDLLGRAGRDIGTSRELIGEPQQEAIPAAGSLWLDLGKNGELLSSFGIA